MGRRQWLFGFLTLVLLWTSPVTAQPARDVVVVGMEAEPPGLDPGQALGLHTLRVTYQIFETLVTTPDDSTDVVPGLAESWRTSPDGLAWTFKLRRGVRFHDGTPLDAPTPRPSSSPSTGSSTLATRTPRAASGPSSWATCPA
jgi:peptide/nickel transport system substrate-binding protein